MKHVSRLTVALTACLAVVAGLLTAVASASAADAAPAAQSVPTASAVTGGLAVTDLGPVYVTNPDGSVADAPYGSPIGVDAAGDVLFNGQAPGGAVNHAVLWRDGSWVAPPSYLFAEQINEGGTVVGFSSEPLTGGGDENEGQFWNTVAGTMLQSGSPDGCASLTLDSIDNQGEAGGAGVPASPGCDGTTVNGNPNTASAALVSSPGADPTQLSFGGEIYALDQQYEAVTTYTPTPGSTPTQQVVLNRSTGAVTPQTIIVNNTALSSSGAVAGSILPSSGPQIPAVEAADGTVTQLPVPAGLSTTFYSIRNASAFGSGTDIIGRLGSYAGYWPSTTSPFVFLQSLLPTGSPWQLGPPAAADASGYVVGTGYLNGVEHYYRVDLGQHNDLSAAISLTDASGRPIGSSGASTVVAKVTLSEGASGAGPITGVTASPQLTLSPSTLVKTVSGPSPAVPAGGWTLTPGSSVSYVETLQAVSTGRLSLAVQASGTEAGGSVSASATATALVGKAGPLVLSMRTTPGRVRLDVDDAGKVTPSKVTVTVTFANTAKVAVTHVQLIGLSPLPQDPTQALAQLRLAPGSLPVAVGRLAPGQKVTRKLTLSVDGDGDYQWRALALFDDPALPGGNGRSTALGGPFTSSLAPLYFSAKAEPTNVFKQASGDFVDAGATWYVKAEVKNESRYKSLCVLPIRPTFSANAAGIGPHDVRAASVRENAPPFAGVLGPGDSATLDMYVDTSPDGATRGKVAFDPQAAVLPTGGTCTADTASSLTPLAARDVTVAKDSREITMHVDTSQPVPVPISAAAKPLYFAGAFAAGTVETLFDSAVALEAGAMDAVSTKNLYALLLQSVPGVAAAKQAIEEYQALVTATDVMGYYWKTASPAEKQNLFSHVASVMARETGDFWSAASGTVSAAAAGYMDKVERVYASGDDAEVMSLYGRGSGSLVTQVIVQVALAEAGQRIVQAAPGLARAFEQVAGESVVISTLKAMPPGKLLNFEEMQSLWGLSKEDLRAFSRIAHENDVLIGVRGRAPISVANLEEGAVWKHENIKWKNVSDIDAEYLGFPKSTLGTVQYRTYSFSEEQRIIQRVRAANLSPADYKVVIDRLTLRFEESKYLKKIEGFSKAGEINVGFNYADNGIDITSTNQIRKFELVETKLPDGSTMYTPYQENLDLYSLRKGGAPLPPRCKLALGSVLCEITGDMDGVYITTTSGGAVPQSQLVKIYNELAAAGWQHPETLTWINDAGEFLFGAKQKILKGLELGGEPMIQFAPNFKQYATYLDLAKSQLINNTNYYLDILGGYTKLALTS